MQLTLVGTIVNPIGGNVTANDDFGADGKGNGGELCDTLAFADSG